MNSGIAIASKAAPTTSQIDEASLRMIELSSLKGEWCCGWKQNRAFVMFIPNDDKIRFSSLAARGKLGV